MRITIRLYKRHDLDLLTLYCLEEYNFKEIFKESIRAYINNKPLKNTIPQAESECVYKMPTKVSFHIHLNTNDKDLIKFVNSITKGRRNNILKNVFRNTLPPVVTPYLTPSELSKFHLGDN